jgi:putative membrane protein
MSDTNVIVMERKKSLAKGIAAGLIAGLAGAAAKMLAERIFPRHAHEAGPTQLDGHSLAVIEKPDKVQWALGSAAGAVYGGLAEYYPAATARNGASFGLVLATLTEEGALQGVGIEPDPEDDSVRGRTSEMTSYAVYGIVTETVRRFLRRFL